MLHHRRMWALIATSLFIGAALIIALNQALAAPLEAYEQARDTWARLAPARYQLDFSLNGDEVSGSFRAEIAGGLVRSLIDTDSGQPLPETAARALERVVPIEQLFALLAESYQPTGRADVDLVRRQPGLWPLLSLVRLSPSMCWLPLSTDVGYDQELGYPRRLSWTANRCDSGMFSLDRFDLEITALRPLP